MKTAYGLLAALLVGVSAPVAAAPVIFFGEDTSTAGTGPGPNSATARGNFISGLTGVGNEDFEAQTLGAGAPLALSFPGSSGTLGATLTGSGVVDNNASAGSGGSNPGRFATSGQQFWEVATGSFSISFASPVSAFGFYGTDIGDFVTERLTLNLTDIGGSVSNFVVPHTLGLPNAANATLFWGFIDPAAQYVSISFTNAGGGADVFAFDDMVIGDREQIALVPEPGTLALLGLGVAGLAALRRRKQ